MRWALCYGHIPPWPIGLRLRVSTILISKKLPCRIPEIPSRAGLLTFHLFILSWASQYSIFHRKERNTATVEWNSRWQCCVHIPDHWSSCCCYTVVQHGIKTCHQHEHIRTHGRSGIWNVALKRLNVFFFVCFIMSSEVHWSCLSVIIFSESQTEVTPNRNKRTPSSTTPSLFARVLSLVIY